MTTQEVLADFITKTLFGDIEPRVIERARAAIIDCVGVSLAGSLTPLATSLLDYFRASGDLGMNGSSLLIGSADRSSPSNAALYNGSIAHALDFDDDCYPGNAHLSVCIVPALVAVLEDKVLFDNDFLCAYIIGYEVAAKVGRVLPRSKREPEWQSTGVLGPIACAAAVSKALGLDRSATMNALGIAASCGAGLRANFGSMTKPLHAGRAAQAGVMAGLLAREGYDSSADVFDGKTGFFRAFGTCDLDEIARDTDASLSTIGRTWEISTGIGLRLKFYAACGGTHNGIEAALRIAKKVDYRDIASIHVGTYREAPVTLPYHSPDEGLQGKFSMEYCVCAALRWGAIRIDTFTDERVRDPEVLALMAKTELEIDDRLLELSEHRSAIVEVTLNSGEKFEEFVEIPKGQEDRWLTIEEQLEKFEDTAGSVVGAEKARKLFKLMSGEVTNGGDVAAYLSNRDIA